MVVGEVEVESSPTSGLSSSDYLMLPRFGKAGGYRNGCPSTTARGNVCGGVRCEETIGWWSQVQSTYRTGSVSKSCGDEADI